MKNKLTKKKLIEILNQIALDFENEKITYGICHTLTDMTKNYSFYSFYTYYFLTQYFNANTYLIPCKLRMSYKKEHSLIRATLCLLIAEDLKTSKYEKQNF